MESLKSTAPKPGMRVKMKDPDDGQIVYGTVEEVYTTHIKIRWDDGLFCDHTDYEFAEIKVVSIPDADSLDA